MRLEDTAEQLRLRHELREYFATFMPADELRAAGEGGAGGPRFREVTRRLGADGWLGLGWPKEYGGRGLGQRDQFVFFDEVQRAGVPFPFVTVNTIGPTLMKLGTAQQRQRYLPGILAGEIVFAVGYTEPSAGTDLAALHTRAVADGDEWVIDGSKVFTTGGNTADFIWLAVRTGATDSRHRGISMVIVPTDDPGYSWSPIRTVGGMSVTATYFTGIRIGADAFVGGVDGGWRVITEMLNHERVGLAALGGRTLGLWQRVSDWARVEGLVDVPWVRADLAESFARLDAMRLLNWRMTDLMARGELDVADASATKVYGTEAHIAVQRILLRVLGARGRIRPDEPCAVLAGELEQLSRQSVVNTFGGGVNDVLRDMVATTGYGLPRTPRRG
ncbi:hypothetical protein ATK17_3247 [Branchiibius hedensis]|uniref:Acyl-CoA dehydrogenase n=1 Tax=Branchiibius hedensis TaxID=672460 RepID=A0A2Y9BUK4_9MICO|nr:acyl-CoA dehydrogenase family protein [Branchiibius hedensis]PWJ27061.1 hypothetical protein ATK17_3247 [Branchiibius hedensis]SSA35872.1 hypothetical protein SAMN04489750_3247 [Branchiibius hedensis]